MVALAHIREVRKWCRGMCHTNSLSQRQQLGSASEEGIVRHNHPALAGSAKIECIFLEQDGHSVMAGMNFSSINDSF